MTKYLLTDIGAVKHQLFEDLYELFKKPEAWETFPDVEPTLQWLRAQGITLGVISNFDERLVRCACASID
jgi:phosphoglycolate phosphatase-like HAD superfamily hydrolase